MARLFVCPHCGAATQVSEEFVGLSGPCANCSRIVTVPAEAAAARGPKPPRTAGDRSAWVLGAAAAFVVLLVAALVVGGKILVGMVEARTQQRQCSERLHQIWVALDSYFNEYGEYPPAVVRDKNGVAMHSWRVLLLPHLGEKEEQLYKEYRFDEPWDGPHNRELAEAMPPAYGCPCDAEAFVSSHTSYLAVIDGATGDFATEPENPDVNRPPPKAGAPAKPKSPYLVVEAAESGISWLEPRDLVLRGAGPAAGAPPATSSAGTSSADASSAARPLSPRSFHLDAVNALHSDGEVRTLSEAEVAAEFGDAE